jgi:hypothetical protein
MVVVSGNSKVIMYPFYYSPSDVYNTSKILTIDSNNNGAYVVAGTSSIDPSKSNIVYKNNKNSAGISTMMTGTITYVSIT